MSRLLLARSIFAGVIAAVALSGAAFFVRFVPSLDRVERLGPFKEFRVDLSSNYFAVVHVSIPGLIALTLAFAGGFWWEFRRALR